MYGFILNDYVDNCYDWELVKTYLKLMLVGFNLIFKDDLVT